MLPVKCDECENTATVHVSAGRPGEIVIQHLCQDCARRTYPVANPDTTAIIEGVLAALEEFERKTGRKPADEEFSRILNRTLYRALTGL
jgi:protein-arginine kinase activator protein McsA